MKQKKITHAPPNTPYFDELRCSACGKRFASKQGASVHYNRTHLKQKDHCCDTCGKAFSTAGILKTHHTIVHLMQKDHCCDTCGKAFSTAGNLKTHDTAVHGQ
jgi:uncharacterized Zn-finger protein